MASSFFLRPFLFRPQTLGLGLGLSLVTFHTIQQRPIRLDTGFSGGSYQSNARTPVIRNGHLNPSAVRQISSGSITGLCVGLLVSTFSKTLALLIGLGIVVVQVASRYGINLIPYNKFQRYITSIDLRSAIQDNVAFKLSFGTTFALAAFMQF